MAFLLCPEAAIVVVVAAAAAICASCCWRNDALLLQLSVFLVVGGTMPAGFILFIYSVNSLAGGFNICMNRWASSKLGGHLLFCSERAANTVLHR